MISYKNSFACFLIDREKYEKRIVKANKKKTTRNAELNECKTLKIQEPTIQIKPAVQLY